MIINLTKVESQRIRQNANRYGLSISRFVAIAALSFKPGYEPVNHEVPKQ